MEFAVVGWPDDQPTLDLDHRVFSYAGKFVMSNTGKAVLREKGEIVAAVSFNKDRSTQTRAWIRYLTVRRDRRGEGIGPQLARATTDALFERGYEVVRIAVNNPFAFHALARSGFGFTGETTGIAELVLSTDHDPSDGYGDGIQLFSERSDLSASERAFIESRPKVPEPVESYPTRSNASP